MCTPLTVARRVLTCALVVAAMVLSVAPTALAHTSLVSCTPADGSSVEGPLREIVLGFSGTPAALDDTLAVAVAAFRPMRRAWCCRSPPPPPWRSSWSFSRAGR